MRSRPWGPILGNARRACCWPACGQRWMNVMRRWPIPAHQALHNLEQLIYLEQVDNLAPGTLLPVAAGLREVAQRKLNQVLDDVGSEIPTIPLGGQYGRMMADPPIVVHDESPPELCIKRRDDWSDG